MSAGTQRAGVDVAIEGLDLEAYAALCARLDVAAARAAAEPPTDPAEAAQSPEVRKAAAREATLRVAGVEPDRFARVRAGFRALMNEETAAASLEAGAPLAERFPLLTRYGALYAAAKKAALAAAAAPVVEATAPAPAEAQAAPSSGVPRSAVEASNDAARKG
jgi:hypothetical protein